MQVRNWLAEMSDQCKCTYRVTRTYKPSLKRVIFKVDLHCQHFRKKLTPKQLAVKKISQPKTMLSDVNQKKNAMPINSENHNTKATESKRP